jgi:hypothetical protein
MQTDYAVDHPSDPELSTLVKQLLDEEMIERTPFGELPNQQRVGHMPPEINSQT